MYSIIMIYYASWQHKLKMYIHKITARNGYEKQIVTLISQNSVV